MAQCHLDQCLLLSTKLKGTNLGSSLSDVFIVLGKADLLNLEGAGIKKYNMLNLDYKWPQLTEYQGWFKN